MGWPFWLWLQHIEQLESVHCHLQMMMVLHQISNRFEENRKYSYQQLILRSLTSYLCRGRSKPKPKSCLYRSYSSAFPLNILLLHKSSDKTLNSPSDICSHDIICWFIKSSHPFNSSYDVDLLHRHLEFKPDHASIIVVLVSKWNLENQSFIVLQ